MRGPVLGELGSRVRTRNDALESGDTKMRELLGQYSSKPRRTKSCARARAAGSEDRSREGGPSRRNVCRRNWGELAVDKAKQASHVKKEIDELTSTPRRSQGPYHPSDEGEGEDWVSKTPFLSWPRKGKKNCGVVRQCRRDGLRSRVVRDDDAKNKRRLALDRTRQVDFSR
jgi:hypothetical protein